MTKFNKGDRFRCDNVKNNVILTITSVNFTTKADSLSQTTKELPFRQNPAPYSYCAESNNENGETSNYVFGKSCEAMMIPA